MAPGRSELPRSQTSSVQRPGAAAECRGAYIFREIREKITRVTVVSDTMPRSALVTVIVTVTVTVTEPERDRRVAPADTHRAVALANATHDRAVALANATL